MDKYCIVSVTDYFKKNIKKKNFIHITNKKYLNLEKINTINPHIIFVPHWNWKIKKEIFDKYITIIFHSTPLPFGRGGSPIQNMILKGFSKTKICAIQAKDEMDSGNIFLKKNLSLKGSANEIYIRMYSIILEMIKLLTRNKLPKAIPQKGKIVIFKRRNERESYVDFSSFKIDKIYDYIRMLDLDYRKFPKAYTRLGRYKLIFSKVKKKNNRSLECRLKIELIQKTI
jgi:methionyl-tRNA formyltransferase